MTREIMVRIVEFVFDFFGIARDNRFENLLPTIITIIVLATVINNAIRVGLLSTDPLFVIMEYAKLGKLQSVLRNSRGVNYYTNTHGPSSLTSHELIMFCYQIAKGMDFLSSKGVRHIEPMTDHRQLRCL